MKHIDASGIRKAFDMSKSMKDPINLSIGLPDFDVPGPVKAAAIEAIEAGHNAYTVTQGIPELRTKIQAAVDAQFGHADRQVLITAGTSGALLAGAMLRGRPGRRGDRLRPLLRDVSPPGDAGRGRVGAGRHVSRLPDRRRPGRGGDDRAHQMRGGQYTGQSHRRRRHGRRNARPGRALPPARRPLDQRRGVPGLLLRSPLRHARELERRRARGRRLQQDVRHDRLAARLRPWSGPLDPGDGQASTIQLMCAHRAWPSTAESWPSTRT